MKCESIKDLKNIIALCRKAGVKSIEVDGVCLELGEAPAKAKTHDDNVQEDEAIESDTPSAEEMLYWSTPNDPTVSDPDEKAN